MENKEPQVQRAIILSVFLIINIIFIIIASVLFMESKMQVEVESLINNENNQFFNDNTFKMIVSSENSDIEPILMEFANLNNIDLQIDYAGTLDIMEKLNYGEEYDAVWTANSIWLYMLNDSVSIKNSKSTSINPVVFAVKESKAKELGFVNKEIYTKDIVNAIKSGNLKFSMSNPTRTNTGATAYLGLLSTLAGNPEVLKESNLEDTKLKEDLVALFSGLERSSGDEAFLEEVFLNGEYDSVVTYESSIININKTLQSQGKETLYVLYPVDGVSISDSPIAFIDNKLDGKLETFDLIQKYILSSDGQAKLAETGRRTWYGGTTKNADVAVFNPDWGINTEKYIVPVKYPNTEVIQKALSLYQSELRKPIHTVFCLDYSGSMSGSGYSQLTNAMNYILNKEEASKDLLQFTEKDKITVIPFSSNVIDVWTTQNGVETTDIINKINGLSPNGTTNIYDTSAVALKLLDNEDLEKYNVSVILMTDGMSNAGSYYTLSNIYKNLNKDIPIYSIMFGNAYEDELLDIANMTNAKVFDGKVDLLKAFKEVRGYN